MAEFDYDYWKVSALESAKPSKKMSEKATFSRHEAVGSQLENLLHSATHEGRPMTCFHCGKDSFVPSQAYSSQCKHCGMYTNLEDIVLNPLNKRTLVRTQGDVLVEALASVSQCRVFCRNAWIQGRFRGDIFCLGELKIDSDNEIRGKVKARSLRIAKQAKVVFTEEVEVEELWVEGEMIGSVRCGGVVTLRTGAVLLGDVVAASLEIPYGAVHQGIFSHVDF